MNNMVTFLMGGMAFEYDENKNRINIEKHGISFHNAARIFFDFDRIEYYDEKHSAEEDRYQTIGDTSAGSSAAVEIDGTVYQSIGMVNEILFVVYTERVRTRENGSQTEIIRLISARLATNFERGLYYGKKG